MGINIGQLASLVIRNYSSEIADNVTDNIALLTRLKSKDRIKIAEGGSEIAETLAYSENTNYVRYSGSETWTINDQEEFDSATYDWRQVGMAIPFNGLETDVQHVGKPAIFNLIKERIANAERSLFNQFSSDLYSDGTATNQINGLRALVADTGQGTVGGINSVTNAFWRNYVLDASDAGGPVNKDNVTSYFNKIFVNVSRGKDTPDLIVCDNNYYLAFLESLQANQRFTGDQKMAKAGYQVLKYLNADVICDGGVGGSAPTNHAYFLNTNYLKLVTAKRRNFAPLDPDRYANNQDSFVKLMAWAGNLTCSNRSLQGVLIA